MITEFELATQAKEGDRDALAGLVEVLRPRLFAEARSCLSRYDDAQDAVASALVFVCRHIGQLREPGSIRAWARKIVRNEALKLCVAAGTIALADDAASSGDERYLALRVDVREALRRLPIDHARALTLFYFSGASVESIAERTGRPVGTVKRWLHQGRRRLAVELEDYAPMETRTQPINAAILATDLDSDLLNRTVRALRDAGFAEVSVFEALPEPVRTDSPDGVDIRLPRELRDTRLVVIDECVGGRSAFELQAVLKASAESPDLLTGVLLSRSPHLDSSMLAAWSAGFDLCLVRDDLDPDELARLSAKLLRA